jgi:phage gp36-like protein
VSYATAAELEDNIGADRFARLVDRDADDSPDSTAVDAALANASSFADSYIARFLPLAEPYPASLRLAVIDLAVYDLAGEHATDLEREKRNNAARWLEHIAAGRASLGVVTPATSPDTEIPYVAARCDWTHDKARRVL